MDEKYDLKDMTIDQLKKLLEEIWNESKEGGEIKKIVEEKGFDYSDLEPLDANEIIEIKYEGVGLDPAATAIIVSFIPVLAEIVKEIWKYVFLPKIKKKREDILTSTEE